MGGRVPGRSSEGGNGLEQCDGTSSPAPDELTESPLRQVGVSSPHCDSVGDREKDHAGIDIWAVTDTRSVCLPTSVGRFSQQVTCAFGWPSGEEDVPTIVMEDALPPDDERTRAFRTHDGYLRAIVDLGLGDGLSQLHTRLDHLVARASTALPAASRSGIMNEELRACLERGWGTELLLAATRKYAGESEIVRLANSWASVQTYYAHYSIFQALIVASGETRPDSHSATQKRYRSMWVDRSFDLLPWTLGCGNVGERHADPRGFHGAPVGGVRPGDIHPWAYSRDSDDAIHVLGQALVGTRKDKITDALDQKRRAKAQAARKAWQEEERARIDAGRRPRKEREWPEKKNLTAQETATASGSIRMVTLLDYLYRLRIKANYDDAAMYDRGPQTDSDAQQFMRLLNDLTAASMLVHELRVSRLLPAGVLEREARNWVNRNDTEGTTSLAHRMSLLQQHG